MKAISWNCQGIRPALTVKALKELRNKYDPNLVFLMEIRNGKEVLERIRERMRFENGFYVDPEGLSGGLVLWWNNEVKVKVLEASKNGIDTLVTMGNNGGMSRVSWIYGSTDFEERRSKWEYVKKSVVIFSIPWMYIGDFNEVKENAEKKGGKWR